jgi:hypothetical protein
VHVGSDILDRGRISAAELSALLESFLQVDPADNAEFDPHLVVNGPAARLIVRTNHGKLYAYDARDPISPAQEVTPNGLLYRLNQHADSRAPEAPPDFVVPTRPPPHHGIAFAMLVVGLALNGYILYSVFYVESVDRKVEVKLLADTGEAQGKQDALAGTWVTGRGTGDRVIEVLANGNIRFYEIGAKGPINDGSDTYQVGRHDGALCLSTVENGVVDVAGETLVYYRDVYQRRRP